MLNLFTLKPKRPVKLTKKSGYATIIVTEIFLKKEWFL